MYDVSIEQVSEGVGFHQRTYAHYENDSRIPTSFKVYYIAIYHNVSSNYIVGRTDEKELY